MRPKPNHTDAQKVRNAPGASTDTTASQKVRTAPIGQGTWADELAMTMYAQWVSTGFNLMVAAAFLETRRRALELLTNPKIHK